jgi:predicted negative regulator of RcsB-dependent stress response
MKPILCLSLSLALLGLLAPAPARAQGTIDEVTYYDRAKKKEETHKGKIESETPKFITIRAGAKAEEIKIPAIDVLNVTYQIPTGRPVYRKLIDADADHEKATDPDKRKAAFTKALEMFDAFREAIKEPFPLLDRDVQFRRARLYARQAEEDPEQVDEAIKRLDKFLTDHADAWQVIPVARMLGNLQELKGDQAGALKTYRTVAGNALVPKDVQQEFGVRQAQALIKKKEYAAAERQLKSMTAGLAADDPQAQRIAVHLAECQVAAGNFPQAEAKLKEILKSNADGSVKALACNTLADGYLEAKNTDEAFWYYLWVDTVYNQDKQERARAVYHLSKLFEQYRNDPARAEQFRNRLLKEKEFDNTDWQKHARSEK